MLDVILPSVLSSLVVGMTSAWLASQRAIATFEIRISAAEKAIAKSQHDSQESRDLLVELKTKTDIILSRLIPLPGQGN